MQTSVLMCRQAGVVAVMIALAVGCTPRGALIDESPGQAPSSASVHAVRARKLKKIMAELDYLRSQRLPQEIDTARDQVRRIDDIRTAADSLAHAAEDIPSVLSEVRLSRSDEDLFYQLAEQLNVRALQLRDEAGELIRTPVQGVFRFEDEAVERILNASELKPYIIQKFCIHAVNHMIEEGRSTIAVRDVAAVEGLVLSDESVAPRILAGADAQANL